MKVQVIPAHLVSMNPSLAPSVSSLEENQSQMNMTQDSRDHFTATAENKGAMGKNKLTMHSIDNPMQGYNHYQRTLVKSPQGINEAGKMSKFEVNTNHETSVDHRQKDVIFQSPPHKTEKKKL